MAFGRVRCDGCLKDRAEHQKALRERKQEGLCITSGCKRERSRDHTMCEFHLAQMREKARQRTVYQVKRGICTASCGRRVEFTGRLRCLSCEAIARIREGLEPLPRYIRKQIKEGFKEYRRLEAQEFLRSWLKLVGEREQRIISLVYGLDGGGRRTLTAAGLELGVKRERARQIHDKGMLRILAVPVETPIALIPIKKRLERYPRELNQKLLARRLAMQAMQSGELIRQPCVKCGALKAEAHHPDYSKPLDVQWLCRPCHDREHHGKRSDEQAA